MEVVIYTNTGCSACQQAKEFSRATQTSATSKKVSPRILLSSTSWPAWGFRAVPVIKVGGETMLGLQRGEAAQDARPVEDQRNERFVPGQL